MAPLREGSACSFGGRERTKRSLVTGKTLPELIPSDCPRAILHVVAYFRVRNETVFGQWSESGSNAHHF